MLGSLTTSQATSGAIACNSAPAASVNGSKLFAMLRRHCQVTVAPIAGHRHSARHAATHASRRSGKDSGKSRDGDTTGGRGGQRLRDSESSASKDRHAGRMRDLSRAAKSGSARAERVGAGRLALQERLAAAAEQVGKRGCSMWARDLPMYNAMEQLAGF